MTREPLSSFCCISLKDIREENVPTVQTIQPFPWRNSHSSFGLLHKLSQIQEGDMTAFHTSLPFLIFCSGPQHQLPLRKERILLAHIALLFCVESHIWVAGADFTNGIFKNDTWPGPEINDLLESQLKCLQPGLSVHCWVLLPLPWAALPLLPSPLFTFSLQHGATLQAGNLSVCCYPPRPSASDGDPTSIKAKKEHSYDSQLPGRASWKGWLCGLCLFGFAHNKNPNISGLGKNGDWLAQRIQVNVEQPNHGKSRGLLWRFMLFPSILDSFWVLILLSLWNTQFLLPCTGNVTPNLFFLHIHYGKGTAICFLYSMFRNLGERPWLIQLGASAHLHPSAVNVKC